MINNRLSELIGKNRLTVTQVAKDTGISRGTLLSIYHNKTKVINTDILLKLCNYFNYNVSDFFYTVEE